MNPRLKEFLKMIGAFIIALIIFFAGFHLYVDHQNLHAMVDSFVKHAEQNSSKK